MCVLSHSVISDSLQPHGRQPTRPLCPWGSPGKNTGVGCHALLQGTFPTQGQNPGLPNWRRILYQLSHQGLLGNSFSRLSHIFTNLFPFASHSPFCLSWFNCPLMILFSAYGEYSTLSPHLSENVFKAFPHTRKIVCSLTPYIQSFSPVAF